MKLVARGLLTAAFVLTFAGTAVLARADRPETKLVAPVATLPTTTTTTAAPVIVTLPPTTVPPPPPTTPPARVAAPPATAPPTSAVPVVRAPSGRAESCGWAWDATRIDDGSLNEVSIMLDAPRRPNEAVTITAKPGAALTSTPAMSHATTTDGGGQAASTFTLSDDKRDWIITVSATFASGSVCSPQTFTLVY